MQLLTDAREVHVWSAAERAQVLVGAVHGPVHTPEAEQVPACVHYGLVHKLQTDDALKLLRFVVRLHCPDLIAPLPATLSLTQRTLLWFFVSRLDVVNPVLCRQN